jgi:hypothetical protein
MFIRRSLILLIARSSWLTWESGIGAGNWNHTWHWQLVIEGLWVQFIVWWQL